jgi:IS30 family transposase
VAQRKHDDNGTHKGPSLKIGFDHELAKHIEDKIIREKYSPDAVIGEIKAKKLQFKSMICTRTLYNYIDRGIFANISNKNLLLKGRRRKKANRRSKIALNNLSLHSRIIISRASKNTKLWG